MDDQNNSNIENNGDQEELDYSTKRNSNNVEPNIPDDGNQTGGTYTTPDGRNGYVRYLSNEEEKKSKKRAVPIALFITVAVVALILLVFSVFAGLMYVKEVVSNTVKEQYASSDNTQAVISEKETDEETEAPEPYVPIEKKESIKSEAETGDIITSAGIKDSILPNVIADIKDSVVVITTESSAYNMWYGEYVTSGAGSGVIIRDDGEIVTNYHVVEGATQITVTLTDGNSYAAKLTAYDESSDIALLNITTETELKAAKLGCSEDLVVGEEVIAIGNPLGTLGGTVTTGIISATARNVKIDDNVMTLLQTNAAVSPGNSGGGLFNLAGELIGIVNAKSSDTSAEGLGFAIPIDHAYTIIEQLEQYGYVRGIVDTGLELYEANRSTASYYFNSNVAGLYVLSSEYTEEIVKGDRIVSVNGVTVSSQSDFDNAIYSCKVGEVITVVVERISIKSNRYVSNQYTVSLELQEYVPENINK